MKVLTLVRITEFKDNYLEQLQEIAFFMWLRVQWDGTIARENVIAAVDENDQLLELGFLGHNIVWVMGFDLENTSIPYVEEQEGVVFEVMERTEDGVKEYLAANELGYDNIQDAEAELWFRLGDERTEVLLTRRHGEIVSSATIWHITDERAATENIFTIPKYRQKKIGTYMLVKTLNRLKEKGYKQATLSCVGDNARAIALYNRIGYKVIGHLLEMHWEI